MADVLLSISEYFLTPLVYGENSSLPKDSWQRQLLSLYIVINIGAYLLYFFTAGLNWLLIFDREELKKEQAKLDRGEKTALLPNQVQREILYTCWAVPWGSIPQALVFLAEARGYSKLYDNIEERGWGYLVGSILAFFFFTDMCIYFIHRGLHDVKFLYTYIHKPHHQWIVTTPWASHAFHPLDGFAQGFPYHMFVFLFPFHKYTYLIMFVAVNVWTVSIHDCSYNVPKSLEFAVNGAAHHTMHHLRFFYNYGQYFTLWDKLCGTHMDPPSSIFKHEQVKEA